MILNSDSEYQRGYADGYVASQTDNILANLMRRVLTEEHDFYAYLKSLSLQLGQQSDEEV